MIHQDMLLLEEMMMELWNNRLILMAERMRGMKRKRGDELTTVLEVH